VWSGELLLVECIHEGIPMLAFLATGESVISPPLVHFAWIIAMGK
jgi:hypothetical protein